MHVELGRNVSRMVAARDEFHARSCVCMVGCVSDWNVVQHSMETTRVGHVAVAVQRNVAAAHPRPNELVTATNTTTGSSSTAASSCSTE